MSKYPVLMEGAHTAEFILSEASGQRSRDNAYFVDPTTIRVGQPVKKTVGATTDTPATYVPATVGADCEALAIYAGVSSSGEGLRLSVISRDAEVNARLIYWGNMSSAEQIAGATKLATFGIIARI
jgi:hypothetical protein